MHGVQACMLYVILICFFIFVINVNLKLGIFYVQMYTIVIELFLFSDFFYCVKCHVARI